MNKTFLLVFTLLVLSGCDPKKNPVVDQPIAEEKAATFFPVTSFIKGQILTLDSLPITPLLITTQKGKTDSTWIPAGKLRPYLVPFLEPEIDETNMQSFFQETRFNDQTLNSITFTYDPKRKLPDSLTLRHWDVYVNPEKGTVTKVYLVKNISGENQRFTQQLTWQTDKYAKIATILNKDSGNAELVKEEMILWSF